MPFMSVISVPLKIKLIMLSLLFAALKHYEQLDWDWITVAAPVLVGASATFIEYIWLYLRPLLLVLFASAETREDWCDTYRAKIEKRYREAFEAVEKVRKVFREMKG